jgi:hypothetical protein
MKLSRFLAWMVLALVGYSGWSAWSAYKNPWVLSSPVLRNLPVMPDDCAKKGCDK